MAGSSSNPSNKPINANANGSQSQSAKRTADGGPVVDNGGAGGAGDGLGGGLDGGGGGYPHPLTQQSLFDYSQPGLGPWGPVAQVLNVEYNGQQYTVNELAYPDPFIHMYQLPNGDLTITNEPLVDVLAQTIGGINPPVPPTEMWAGPSGPVEIFSNQILVDFDQQITEQELAALIAAQDLHVTFSWFEPADPEEPETNNAMAWFWFEFQDEVFETFQDAYDFFGEYPHVLEVVANEVEAFHLDYAAVSGSTLPADRWYSNGIISPPYGNTPYQTRHVQALGIDTTDRVRMGPPYGGSLSNSVGVAVIDDGVQRWHADFTVPGSVNRKISKYGVTCGYNYSRFGVDQGQPSFYGGYLRTHGTQCAGTITATTYDQAHSGAETGVPSCAPQNGVFPIAVAVRSDGFDSGSLAQALAFMKACLKYGYFLEAINVVNMSFSNRTPPNFLRKMIIDDLKDSERLYVATAGNLTPGEVVGDQLLYPAAWPEVLGVSGLWADYNVLTHATTWYARERYGSGSNYKFDANQPPLNRVYPVSGIFGIGATEVDPVKGIVCEERPWSRSTSTYRGYDNSEYDAFAGTSFACPQVAALAALLFDQYPNKRWEQVRARIISTRDTVIEGFSELQQYQLAGPIRFHQALAPGW